MDAALGTDAAAVGFPALANTHKLIDLNITYNYMEDLTPLLGLKRLKPLWICRSGNREEYTPVLEEVYQQLKAALPDIYIDNWSEHILGGWREHSRFYDLEYTIFNWEAATYIPWTIPVD